MCQHLCKDSGYKLILLELNLEIHWWNKLRREVGGSTYRWEMAIQITVKRDAADSKWRE